jgi:hypothetical protein
LPVSHQKDGWVTHDLYGRRLLDHLQGYVIQEGMSDEQLCLDCIPSALTFFSDFQTALGCYRRQSPLNIPASE